MLQVGSTNGSWVIWFWVIVVLELVGFLTYGEYVRTSSVGLSTEVAV